MSFDAKIDLQVVAFIEKLQPLHRYEVAEGIRRLAADPRQHGRSAPAPPYRPDQMIATVRVESFDRMVDLYTLFWKYAADEVHLLVLDITHARFEAFDGE